MNLTRTWRIFLKNLNYIILATFIFALIGAFASFILPSEYETNAKLMVITYNPNSEKVFDEYMVSQKLASTFASVAMTNPVLDKVNKQLGTSYSNDTFVKMVTVKSSSEIITITVKGSNTDQVKNIANAFAGALLNHIDTNIFPGQSMVKIINQADEPQKPGILYYLVNAVKGGIVGFALVLIYVLAIDLIKSPVKSSKEVKTLLDMDVLGKIKYNKKITDFGSRAYDSEEFRFLRINLRNHIKWGSDKVIEIISPAEGEGKTTVCSNVAASMTFIDKKVLVVDCNLVNRSLSKKFNMAEADGLCELLDKNLDMDGFIKESPVKNMYILPAGKNVCHNLLGSDRMAAFLSKAREKFDFIFLDTPGFLKFSDAGEILYLADQVLIVAEFDDTSSYDIARIKDHAALAETGISGLVINKSNRNKG